ncbi:hypothetical protein [Pseudomonas sp. GM48]|uniref:hypothetical protein n=1 Tax=Pseudomonas sp. GM48 TaxID=1144330 RepID=UPI00026FFFFF|nr:hypothetical protein [Pseudomonas sp. GM48]EJM48116.1 hypothetical protein PMI28_05692 [Pseudomonas sp. GM48]
MTKHDIYDEHEGFRLWNYMECETLESGQEVWRINVEVKRVDEVVIPVGAGDQTYSDRGLAQVAGRELGAKLAAEWLNTFDAEASC